MSGRVSRWARSAAMTVMMGPSTTERRGAYEFADLRRSVVDGSGELDAGIRRAAFEGHALPSSLEAYAAKVRECAYKVTDTDVAAMRAAGWSEEQIFELTMATALGAAMLRHDRARAAMTEAS